MAQNPQQSLNDKSARNSVKVGKRLTTHAEEEEEEAVHTEESNSPEATAMEEVDVAEFVIREADDTFEGGAGAGLGNF